MSGLIQQFAHGVLPLLRITGGDVPKLLADTVAPTFDLSRFYTARVRAEVASSATNVNAAGGAAGFAVPANEMWIVEYIGASMTAQSAGPVVDFCIGYQLIAGSGAFIVKRMNGTLAAIGDSIQDGFFFGGQLILPPNAQVVALNTRAIGANQTLVCNAVVTRLNAG